MTTGAEAPIGSPGGRIAVEVEALLGGPRSEIDRWVDLDTDAEHDNRSRRVFEPARLRPLPDLAVPTARPAAMRSGAAILAADEATFAICVVLEAWRAAERELVSLAERDADWRRVHAELVGLRALHHRLFDARMSRPGAENPIATPRWVDFLSLGPPVLARA